MEKRLKDIILSQQGAEGIIEREAFRAILQTLPMEEVTTVVGPRRAGKSSALRWVVEREGGVYANFEDPRLPREASFILELHDAFPHGPLALDEVHLVEGWERAVASLIGKRKVIVSGSTAHLLSREYGTFLTGRHVTVEVLPLSYEEFKAFGGKDYEEYLFLGGYPRVVMSRNKALLGEYLADVVARDVAFRHRVDAKAVEELAAHLLAHSSKRFTERRLSTVLSLSPNTVGEYLSYLEEAFLLERLYPLHPKLSARRRMPFKVHAVDHGYISHLLPDKGWKGRALETALYWSFRRETKDLLYYPSPEGDIVVHRAYRPLAVVNAAYELREDNREREEAIASLRVPFKALVAVKGEARSLPTYRPWEFRQLWEDLSAKVGL